MPYWLRHYSSFCDKLIVFDEFSTDSTRHVVSLCPKAELRKWPHRGLDDNRFVEAVNTLYKEARGKADWVIWADPDEILYHPEPLKVLSQSKADVLQATGYGMVTKEGPPKSEKQIYEIVRRGVRQENYDKCIIWRPSIDIQHTHGRHTYPGKFPIGGTIEQSPFKLLHYHYFGVEYTAMRNRRNYARSVDKKFAWNYAPGHNENPKQNGSVAWVEAVLKNGHMIDVLGPGAPIKLHLGCGGYNLEGWENHDSEMDIRKALPFPNESVSCIQAEHVVEHITHKEAWNFFGECHRVLIKGGIVRIAIPDFTKLQREITQEYQDVVKAGGHGDGSKKAALRAMVFEHGHQAVWNGALLRSMLQAHGFSTSGPAYGESTHEELKGVEQHWKTVGKAVAEVETTCIEGTKP